MISTGMTSFANEFREIKNNIIIEDTVTLKRDDNIMKGELLVMDLNTGLSQITSDKSTKKVKMRFSPKKADKNE